ncbi:YkyB-like protein [Lachnospiraceae bacterium]|nr:YkyB-like protein [Lachnospiraceae bacterium]
MNDIIKECIDLYRNGDNFSFVLVNDLRRFIKCYVNPSVNSKTSKNELVEMAKEALNEESFFTFLEIDRFGLLRNQILNLLGISDYVLDKMVKNNQISILASISYTQTWGGKRTYNIYSMKDVIFAEVPQIHQVIIPDMTEKNLEEALYLVNKSAKVSRDTKEQSYKCKNHKQVKASKTRSNNLYCLKDSALHKMIDEKRLHYMGVHKQIIGNQENYLSYYIGHFYSYHIPCAEFDEKDYLGEIQGKISSEKTVKTDITFPQAVLLIKEYINKNE